MACNHSNKISILSEDTECFEGETSLPSNINRIAFLNEDSRVKQVVCLDLFYSCTGVWICAFETRLSQLERNVIKCFGNDQVTQSI